MIEPKRRIVVADEPIVFTEAQKERQRAYAKRTFSSEPLQQYNTAKDFMDLYNYKIEQKEYKLLHFGLIKAMSLYVTNDAKFLKLIDKDCLTKPSLQKGFLLVGDYGIGKSELLKLVNEVCQELHLPNPIKGLYKSTISIVKESKSNEDEVFKRMTRGLKIFDDLGADHEHKHYADQGSVLIGSILEQRYMNEVRTHASTNFNHSELGKIYGKRLYSRFWEMFNIIELTGKDLRA